MKTRTRHLLVALTVVAMLETAAVPAHATFPGKNGRIAFILGPDIYTMNSDGSDVEQLTNLGPDNSASWESWSPNGKRIVFSEFPPPDFNGQLWTMNADGSNQKPLLAESGITEVRPSFSPDGNSVIFSRGYDTDQDTGKPLIVQLYRINLDGTGLTQLTSHTTLGVHDYGPKYSPDGKTVLVQCDQRAGILDAAWLLDPDGKNFRQLTPSPISGRRPDWSPDGQTIVFQTHCCNPQNETVAVITADGHGKVHELTHNGHDYNAGPHDFDPSWSPEGDAVVFEREPGDKSSSAIFIVKVDGSGLTQTLVLPPSKFHANPIHRSQGYIQNPTRGRRLREIEEGGVLPRWGPAPN